MRTLALVASAVLALPLAAGELVGVAVIPHQIAENLKYRKPRDPGLSARVQLFIQGPALPNLFNGKTPAELLSSGDWAWHDLATAKRAPDGQLTVWTLNGKSAAWGVGRSVRIEADGLQQTLTLTEPKVYLSALTFLSSLGTPTPDNMVLHLQNKSDAEVQVNRVRLWLPESNKTWEVLKPGPEQAVRLTIPAQEKGCLKLAIGLLPLTYCALEVSTSAGQVWAHQRIKAEQFDISGGWVNDHLKNEPYLKLLQNLHINTGQIDFIPGYTDEPKLYNAYPLKRFNRLWPLEQWDQDEILPSIHAVEFLGEPQFGGGRPVPPQEVFDKLLPYRSSRLATSVTHSEERIWRWYAGLSDFPHYDAYRVVAPAADSFTAYDRWNGQRISWGAPLETIGDLCRNLRELNRPMPCAYWSQGPHHGWGAAFSPRKRRSPTAEELRSQALHALASRITSLYWFNLSLKSLKQYPDTWDAIRELGREIKMLAPLYLEGDAYSFRRQAGWELSTIATPNAAVLFAVDTAYRIDPKQNIFVFDKPRPAEFSFPLPTWLRQPKQVFRVDAQGVHEARWQATDTGVTVTDERSQDAIYVATSTDAVRTDLLQRWKQALAHEAKFSLTNEERELMLK